jgi:hypothetical protein
VRGGGHRVRREPVRVILSAWWMDHRFRERYAAVSRDPNERARRLFGAAEARTAGHGGITASSRATGLARSMIGRGLKDLDDRGSGLVVTTVPKVPIWKVCDFN